MEEMKVNVTPAPGAEKIRIEYQEPHEYVYSGLVSYLRSTDAVIDLINKRGSQGNTLIYYLDNPGSGKIKAILDDSVTDRAQDVLQYSFEKSDTLKEWEGLLDSGNIDQKGFMKFLKRRDPSEFADPSMLQTLLAIAQTLNVATVINFDSMYQNENNKEVSFKVKEMDSSTTIPDAFCLSIPLLNESDYTGTIEIELELVKPRAEGQKAQFVFACPKLQREMKAAMQYEVDKLRAALPGYTILAGTV